MSTDPQLADFINEPPIVFIGLTSDEVQISGGMAALIGLCIGGIGGTLMQHIVVGVAAFVASVVFLTWLIAHIIRKNKQNRPSGYLRERIHRIRSEHNLGGSDLIDKTETWGAGRRL